MRGTPEPLPPLHQVSDLRRLLELYERWQKRFYPYCDFDTFVTKLEKAGRSRAIKVSDRRATCSRSPYGALLRYAPKIVQPRSAS